MRNQKFKVGDCVEVIKNPYKSRNSMVGTVGKITRNFKHADCCYLDIIFGVMGSQRFQGRNWLFDYSELKKITDEEALVYMI